MHPLSEVQGAEPLFLIKSKAAQKNDFIPRRRAPLAHRPHPAALRPIEKAKRLSISNISPRTKQTSILFTLSAVRSRPAPFHFLPLKFNF
jgi:hypothetical protein